jgi:hypothetical protein
MYMPTPAAGDPAIIRVVVPLNEERAADAPKMQQSRTVKLSLATMPTAGFSF